MSDGRARIDALRTRAKVGLSTGEGQVRVRAMAVCSLLAALAACGDDAGAGATTTSSTEGPATTVATTTTSMVAVGPHARGYAVMAADGHGLVLMTGGFDCPSCDPTFSGFGDMWALGPGGTWSSLPPNELPPVDDFAFDTESNRAVYVDIGGNGWSFDPDVGVWESLEVDEHPAALHGSKMVYDAGSDRMILFSGDSFSLGSVHDQTWALDLDRATWELMAPPQAPPRRTYYAMAYDIGSDRVILFGGSLYEGVPLADTWAYDYDTNTWELMSPEQSPPARVYAAAAYDAVSDRVILYGGSVDEETAAFEDTWAYDYDTDTWTQLAASSPFAMLAWHAMASSADGVVLFGGGVTRDDYLAEVWIFDPVTAAWTPASAP